MKDKKFAYFQQKILEHLERLEAKELRSIKKSLREAETLVKAGLPIGTIRTWKGKKFIKIAPNKWKPKYDGESRGAKMAIAALKKKAANCTDSKQLMQLVLENRSRFSDDSGRPLPFVQELSDYVSELNDKIESGKRGKRASADGGNKNGGVMNKKKQGYTKILRTQLKNTLRKQFGLHKNKQTGIEANLSGNSVDKMGSDKAIEKSKNNGFTVDEHFEVANKIVELYENAALVEVSSDRNGSENLKSIKRFDSAITLQNGKNSIAHITVKESVQNGHKIYSVEVMELKKNTADKNAAAGGEATR